MKKSLLLAALAVSAAATASANEHVGMMIASPTVDDLDFQEYAAASFFTRTHADGVLIATGELVQKPFSGLEGMRSATKVAKGTFTLSGAESLSPVSGRAAELPGMFTVGSQPFGFKVFKNSKGEGSIIYNPNTGQLTADFSRLTRLVNDGGVYDGIYRCSLPEFQRNGADPDTLPAGIYIRGGKKFIVR